MGKATEDAVSMLRSYAEFMSNNAESLVGDLDSIYVSDGIDVSFRLSSREAPSINVCKSFFVLDRRPRSAGNE